MHAWHWIAAKLASQRAPLRYCLRMSAAALIAFGLTQFFTFPLHGLWAVLTAIVVTQVSIGGSLRATTEYVAGTFCGTAYASLLGLLVPHASTLALAGLLALAVAPLAYAAALSPSFRVAPFTAILVLLIARQLGEGPVMSGLIRLGEVALGGGVALGVSLVVLPERAHGLGLDQAARALDTLGELLAFLLGGFAQLTDPLAIERRQNEAGQSVTIFQGIAEEAARENVLGLFAWPNLAPLSRTLLRLRHDLVIIGRAAFTPLPEEIGQRLNPVLADFAAKAREYLGACGAALVARAGPPESAAVDAPIDAYAMEVTRLRSEGRTRALTTAELEQLFALGFALEELRGNFADLSRCVRELARPSRAARPAH